MKLPRILILTNSPSPNFHLGQVNGYELMVNSKELASVRSVSHREEFDQTSAFERVHSAVKENNYDIVLIWTPGMFPAKLEQFEKIIQAINGRPILYWEGDAWGKAGEKKPVTKQMSWWMTHSEIVFSTVSEPHFSIFKELGARSIRHIPNTYCHFKFKKEERYPPIPYPLNDEVDFSIIASNTARIPGVTGTPGALRRWELITRVHFNSKYSNRIYGCKWPRGWSEGLLTYELQGQEIRKSKINLNWDNFDKYEDYSSDRLPIALLAGRPHVTTKHPGMLWLPTENIGLYQETSPKRVLKRGEELLSIDPKIRFKLGLEAHNWVVNRLSHREAARYIMSTFCEHIKKPTADPWGKLPQQSI